jgi:hypothetical protein
MKTVLFSLVAISFSLSASAGLLCEGDMSVFVDADKRAVTFLDNDGNALPTTTSAFDFRRCRNCYMGAGTMEKNGGKAYSFAISTAGRIPYNPIMATVSVGDMRATLQCKEMDAAELGL